MPVATAVSIASITFLGNVVTVNTSGPHGLAAGQGFSLTGVNPSVYNVNSTVVAVNSATQFTFNLSNPASFVSGGSLLPAKEVIILATMVPNTGQTTVNYLLWLTTSQPVAGPSNSSWSGASAQENAAIAAGTTVETFRTITVPASLTKVQIQAILSADFTAKQTALASAVQPGAFFGGYFDGTGWSI